MNDIFNFVEIPYNLRSNYELERKRVKTVYHGSESLSALACKLWDFLLNSTKYSSSLSCVLHLVVIFLEISQRVFYPTI